LSRIARVRSQAFNVSAKTHWFFVAAESDDGREG